jgi:hypothetical protein
MDQPTLTREARYLIILNGWVLERCIENRARTIAEARSSDEIAPEDIEKAMANFFREELSDLPHFVQQAMEERRSRLSKAA